MGAKQLRLISLVVLCLGAMAVAVTANAQVFTPSGGTPGTYTPAAYGWLGVGANPDLWEIYRKGNGIVLNNADTVPLPGGPDPSNPSIFDVPNCAQLTNEQYGPSVRDLGEVIGTVPSTSGNLLLRGFTTGDIELKVGFIQQSQVAAFLAATGGDGGNNDPNVFAASHLNVCYAQIDFTTGGIPDAGNGDTMSWHSLVGSDSGSNGSGAGSLGPSTSANGVVGVGMQPITWSEDGSGDFNVTWGGFNLTVPAASAPSSISGAMVPFLFTGGGAGGEWGNSESGEYIGAVAAPVPEPSTLALLACVSLAGLWMIRRKRKMA